MRFSWLIEHYYDQVFGRDWPPIILMGTEAYRQYTHVINFKMNRANAPLPESLTVFQGAVVAVDKQLPERSIKIISNNGDSKVYELPEDEF